MAENKPTETQDWSAQDIAVSESSSASNSPPKSILNSKAHPKSILNSRPRAKGIINSEEITDAPYDKAYVDNLLMQYEYAKNRADQFQEGFAAIADMLYEALSYINATRIYNDQKPVMADDINRLIESNPILNQMTNELRKASIESGLGMVSQMTESQNNLKQTVMAHWHRRMHDPALREDIGKLLFPEENKPQHKTSGAEDDPDGLFLA